MKKRVGHNLVVELSQERQKGTPWQVRVYKRVLGFKRPISNDWFLDEEQARTYAEQLASDLASNGSTAALRRRKPGWTWDR